MKRLIHWGDHYKVLKVKMSSLKLLTTDILLEPIIWEYFLMFVFNKSRINSLLSLFDDVKWLFNYFPRHENGIFIWCKVAVYEQLQSHCMRREFADISSDLTFTTPGLSHRELLEDLPPRYEDMQLNLHWICTWRTETVWGVK